MMNAIFKFQYLGITALFFAVLFFGACKKSSDDTDIPAGKKYPSENLQAKLTNQTVSSGSTENSVIIV